MSEGFEPEVRLSISFTVATNGQGQHSGFFMLHSFIVHTELGDSSLEFWNQLRLVILQKTILAFLVS